MDQLKYGHSSLKIPDWINKKATWLLPNTPPPPAENPQAEILQVLRNPYSSLPLSECAKPSDKIAIIVSDISRPAPSYLLLPPILQELTAAGCPDENIMIVFALGIHRKMTPAEMAKAIGKEVYARYKTTQPDDFVLLGHSSYGTPFEVARVVAEADFVILTGNLEFHYFAGYSGGYKAIMPGVSTRAAIQNNHKMMLDPASAIGVADGNPVRMDIEECRKYFPRAFMLNVLLDSQKQILAAVAGDPIAAHRQGAALLDRYYKIPVEEAADTVIVSAGGYPKDINLYQAQKALDNASHVVKKGGRIVLVGELSEGLGEDIFEEWLIEAPDPPSLLQKIREQFVLGGHKAAAIAKVLAYADIYLLSQMDEELVRNIFFIPVSKLEDAVPQEGSIYIIPYGNQTLPVLK